MATEGDVTEPVSLMERGVNRCLNTGELNQPPKTVDYLVKGVASNVVVEIIHCSFEGNAGVTAGESFFESSSIAKVPDEETSTKQETCQADEISYQAEQTMLDKKQIKEEESLKAVEEIGTKEEVMNEINKRAEGDERSCEISHAKGISLEVEKIEQPSLKIGEEETSKEEILFDKVETNKQGIVEQNQTNDSQKDGGEGRKSNKDTELKTSNQVAVLEASTGQDKESVDLNPDLTVHSLDIGVQTSTQSSLKIEAEDNRGHAETATFEENNGEKISGVGEQEDSCPSFLDGENSPDVAKPIEKIESEEEDIRYNSIGEASVLATSPEIQSNTRKSSAIMEDGKDKLDSPSATLATDRSSVQEDRLEVGDKLEDTSNIKSTDNQDASNSNKKTKDITTSLDGNEEKYFVVPSIIQTEHLCLREVDKADISKVVSETLSDDIVKPQESTIEELKTKPEAERSGGEKVKGETTAEGKLENLSVKHEDVETNKDEGVTTSEASAVGNIDKSRDTVVEDEDNIRNAVITPEYNQDGSRNEKNLPPAKLNEKTEIEEVEVQNKICGELDTTHSLIAEKELRQDSDFEPQNQIGEANGASKYEEKNNDNDPQAPESTEKTILEHTSAKEAVTTETEIEKSEKVQELNFDKQSGIKDAEMSIKEDAPKKEEISETQNYKLELTSDDTAKCHTEESTSEKFSSIDFLHETTEKNFQAESLHEAATVSKDEEEDNEKTRSTINEEITGVNKVTEKNIGDNVTNLSSEIINKETVDGYQKIAKEADISEEEDTKEQSIEGNYIACISLEAVEESPVKNFKNDENNTESSSSREILVESETAETIDSITNEAKQSDEIDNSTIQCSLLQEQEILQSENISEGSSVEETNVDISSIKNDEDKENHTELPLAEVGEHKEILKDDQDLEQIMQKNECKENIEYPLNIISAETDTGTLSQLEQRTFEERVESPQDNKMEAEKEKEENILNESNINSLPQEYIAQDPVNFQNDDGCTDKSSAGILEESMASGTCESFSNETNQNVESPIETIPPSLADMTAASEGFGAKDDTTIKNWEESSDKKDKEETSVDIDNIRNETVKLKNLPPRELNEKIESAEFETLDRNVNHSEEKELAKVIDFEPQDQVHEANRVGIDEVKNDETESQACQSTENTDLELLSAKGAENTEASLFTSETEIEKLEKIHESESKETVDSKGAEMDISEDIENKEEACKEEIHKLATSDDSEKYHTENIASLHKTDEQKFQAATTLEGEENSRKTVSIINEEIMGIGEVADEENIKDNFRQLSSEVFNKDTAESYQKTEKETDVTKGSNTEEQVMEQNNAACTSQKSDEEEAVEISQNYEKNIGKPNSGEIFEESETAETVDGIASEAKQIDESPNSAPQCSQVKEHESSQSEYITICDGSSAEEINVDGSSIKKEEDKEKYTGLVEVGEHSEELLEGEDVEEILQKDEPNENIEQLLNVISEETEAGASSQTDDNTVEETVESQLNNKRDAEKEKEDIVNESNIKCLLLESVAKNDAKNFEKDENRAEKSNTEILEESEAVETGEKITDETNQNDENPNATISSSLAKEVESLKCEDMANPEEASAEEKRKEGSSIKINDNIPMLEESNKEIDKATSETAYQFVHEMNQNEESPNSSLQASVVREDAKQILQKDEPKENNEQPHKTIEETVERPQDNEKGAKTTKEEDIRNESKTRSLSLESLAHDPLKNLENDGGSAEKSNTEIPKQSEAAETVEDITHETNQNDSPNETIPAPVAEDLESLQCEVKDIHAEDSPEEKKEEPSSIKISIDNDKITMLEEANKDSDQEKSKTVDYSAHKIMNQIDESLNSSIQAPVVREQETPQGDNLTPVEASPMDEKEENDSLIKKDEEKDNNVLSPGTELDALSEVVSNPREEIGESSQDNVKETEMPEEEDDSKEHTTGKCNIKSPSKESVEERTNKNLQNDEDNAEMSNREIFESATSESIVLETNQNYENPNATIPTAPVKEEETLQGKDKNVNLAEILLDEKEDDDGSPIKAGEVNNSIAELAEAIKSREKEISHGEELIEPKIQNEPEEFLESSRDVITEESKAGMLNEKADDVSIPKEVGAFQNSEETVEKETEEASKESVGDRTNENFQNDEDDAEISNKEIFEEPATGETNESIALEKNQNYKSPNATIPTAPVKEEETLQGKGKNVNLAEILLDEKEDDDGSPIKAGEVNNSNAELAEAIKSREKEISHGEELIEPKIQNEPEEFLESSRDVVTEESKAGMLNEKADDGSIPKEVGAFQNSEETVEKETEEASKESVGDRTNENFQNDEDDAEISNKEIFEEPATGETNESIALEKNQNYKSPNATIPTAPVKEEETLQGKGKNVNLAEILLDEKEDDDGSPIKAGEVNNSNAELAEAIKSREKEISHGEELIEPKIQNEPEEFLESSRDVITEEFKAGMLNEKADDVSIPKEVGAFQNSKETVQKETEEASKESVGDRTNENFQNDEDDAEISNKEIFEEPATGETNESIALEKNQNYKSPNATIPTAPVKEEETLQGKGKNVNLAEILLDEKEDDDGSPIKAGEVNNSNAELAEAIKSREKEISHGEELIEPKIQNEPEEFLESSRDVITEEFKAGMLNEKADDVSIPKEVGAFQNSEETVQKETEEASKESVGDRTNENFQNDEDDAEISNKEIFEEPATGETNESIALEKNQNYKSPNATIPTAPVKEEETLQGKGKNVNLAEILLDEKEDDDGSPIKAGEVNNSNAELAEAIKSREKEISHGEELIEQKIQNELEEFLESSRDVITEESKAGMLNEKADDVSIPKEVGAFQNSEEKETEETSEESVEEGTNKNLQYDEDNTEKFNKEIFEESATGEIGESIALETKQNNESPSATIPTSSVKEEESLQGKGKNVNLTEALSEEKKEDDGSPFKVTEVNDSNVELAVAIKNSEKEVSHGEEIIEPNLQNEPEEFLESSRDEKADDISIPEEDGAFKNSEETVEKEIGEASKESATGTNKNLQNDEDNAEMSNKEIFEESAAGETGESIALETNQNYESPNATIPTAPLKEEENQQRKVKNVNLAEALSEEKKEDDGSPIKANEINDSNAELAETIKKGEKEISHGEEITELKLQNEREEFLESSQDVIAEESKAGILNEKDDDSGILEEDGAFQNTEETVEKETEEGNEDTDGSKVNNVSASEDVKLAAKICDANLSVEDEEVEEKSVATEMELERNKFHGLDSVENLGKYTSDNTEEEMKEDNIEVHRDKTACLNEDIEKHITIAEHTTTDISPQPAGEETDLIYKGEEEEEKPQAEMHEEHELTSIVEDTEKQVLEEVDIVKDQYTEPAIVTLDDMTVTVPKTEMHEITQIAKEDGNTGKQIMEESSVTKDILEVPQRGINEGGEPEKAKEDENDTIKSKDEIEGIESEFREEIDARGYELAKEVETSQDKQGSDLDLYPAKACEEQMLTKGIEQEDRRQLESSGTDTQEEGLVTVERKGTMVDRVDMNASQDDVSNLDDNRDHEIPTEAGEAEDDIKHEIQDKALIERNDDQNEMIVSETFSGKISDGNLKEHSELPSNNTELMNSKESKPIDDNSAKDPTASENIEIEWISQVIEPAHDEDKISTAEKISELGIVDAGKVNRDEEAGSFQSKDRHQDLELHDEQIISTTEDAEILKMETTNQVDQQQICKSETSKDEELSKAGDEALKCIESINEDKEETILDEEGSANKSETSLKENDAAEKAAVEHEAGTQIQKVKITETKNYGIPTEEILKSTESSIKLDHTSEIVPSDQSNETIPATSANKLEENGNSESVEQRSQESSEAQQETEEKTDPNMEVEDQIRETQNAEDIKVAILTEEAHKEVEKAEGDENIEHINKDENDIKELHSVSIEDERVEEVKEGSPAATEYLKPTDSSEQTETASLAVQDAQNMEKERTILEEKEETKEADEGCEKAAGLFITTEETEEVITEQIIDDTDISCNKIKATTIVEVTTEPSLEKVQTDEKPLQASNIPLDARGLHTAEADASQQESIELEDNSSNLSSQLPTDDQEKLTSENVALENIAVNDIEESRKASDVIYETKNHDVEELCTGEVGEEINEVSETVYKSQDNETVTEAEVAIDQTLLEEITKEHEAPALAATTENIDENMEKVVNKKDESPKNSSALKTIEDRSPQPENPREIEVSQLDLQVKKAMPEGPTEEHEEKGGNLDDSKEESEETTETVSQSECYNPEAAIVNEFDDDQTLHNEKAEEQYQIEPCASPSKELELGSLTEIKKIEENIKGEDLLEHEMKTSQEVCLQKEESRELQVSELDLELNEDTKESPNKAEKEAIGTSVEIEEKKEASKSISESNLKGNRAAKEEETNLLQTNTMEKSKEQNQMPSYALVSKEQEGETSAIIGSTDEQTKKEVGALKMESKAIEEACLQKEEPRELQVSSFEFQLDKDAQESLKEIHQREDGPTDGAREEIKEVSELVLKSSSEDQTKVAEDEINSNQPPSTEKIKEQNQTSSSGLLFEEQGQGTSTTAQSIEEKKTREEVPENAPKTIEEAPLLNKETRELKYAQLKLQPDDDIQKESRKEVHEAEDGTAKESLKLQPQHENEKGDAAKTDLMATENQGEKPTDATEIMHNEVTNEQIIEEKNDAKNPYAITLGEEATIESHKEHQLIVEETLGARILEKKTQNEVLPEEIAKADVSETTEKQISKEKGTVESLHQTFLKKETEKEHFRDETGEKIIQEGRELNNENECDDAISGDGSMKSAYGKGLNDETSRNEGASGLAEAIEVVQDIHQQEKTYDSTLGNQIYRQIKPKTTTSTGKKEVPEVLQEPNVETTKVTEVRELQSAYTTDADSKVQRLEHGVEHEVDNKNGKAIEETVSKDLAKMSLFDMMQRSTRERQAAKELNEEREPMASKEEIKCEKQTEERIKMKSDEEVEEEEEEEEEEEVEEHKKNDSASDAPVMVEASRDIEIKVVHKKSHNILSGVKSKVKHSIIKVTKAITGKSSHPKHHHG